MRRVRRLGLVRAGAAVLASGVLVAGVGCTPTEPPSTKFADQVKAAQPGGAAAGALPWFCRSQGEGEDHVPENGHHNAAYEGKHKGELSMEDCAQVADFLDKAWTTARRYPTRRVAQAAGAVQAVQFMPGVGTHDIIPGVTGPQFDAPDPTRPFYLQYDGDSPDAPLAGMSWYVIRYDRTPPPGPAGDNDWWHTHTRICYSAIGIAIGNEISDAECYWRGGMNQSWTYGWMLHAWIVPGYENRYDVFAGAFGCVKGTGPYAPAGDPCYLDHSDPEHGHASAAATGAAAQIVKGGGGG